jgi:1-acyl-sn-glycerol-3-phosphate acyltransferase
MLLYRVVTLVARPLIWLVFRPCVRGREQLPRGGCVLAATHLSGWDVVALSYAVAPRVVRTMGKNQLFARPLLGPVVRSLGAFPAHGGGVEAGAAIARRGQAVAIFPTGARRRLDKAHRPRTGAAAIAIAAGVPLVPVGLAGTDGWRERTRWRVAIGPPLPPGTDRRETTQSLAARIAELESGL